MTTPSPEQLEPSSSGSPLFQTPRRPDPTTEPSLSPSSSTTTLESPTPEDLDPSPSTKDTPEADHPSLSPDELPGESGGWLPGWLTGLLSSRGDHAKREEIKPHAEKAVNGVGELLNSRLTVPNSPERQVGLYLPDAEDVENIADPLAGLVSRRVPTGAGSPDVADLFNLAAGIVGWALKQRKLRRELRRALAEQAARQAADASTHEEVPAA